MRYETYCVIEGKEKIIKSAKFYDVTEKDEIELATICKEVEILKPGFVRQLKSIKINKDGTEVSLECVDLKIVSANDNRQMG